VDCSGLDHLMRLGQTNCAQHSNRWGSLGLGSSKLGLALSWSWGWLRHWFALAFEHALALVHTAWYWSKGRHSSDQNVLSSFFRCAL